MQYNPEEYKKTMAEMLNNKSGAVGHPTPCTKPLLSFYTLADSLEAMCQRVQSLATVICGVECLAEAKDKNDSKPARDGAMPSFEDRVWYLQKRLSNVDDALSRIESQF